MPEKYICVGIVSNLHICVGIVSNLHICVGIVSNLHICVGIVSNLPVGFCLLVCGVTCESKPGYVISISGLRCPPVSYL
jgi:hypothetical protein